MDSDVTMPTWCTRAGTDAMFKLPPWLIAWRGRQCRHCHWDSLWRHLVESHVAVLKFPDPQISTEYKHTLPNRDDKTMGPGQRTSCSQAAESLAACGQVADEEAIYTHKKKNINQPWIKRLGRLCMPKESRIQYVHL